MKIMKAAGVFGLLLIVLTISFTGYYYFVLSKKSSDLSNNGFGGSRMITQKNPFSFISSNLILLVGFIGLFSFFYILFLIGFMRLGRFSGSTVLLFSSKMLFVCFFIFLVFFSASTLIGKSIQVGSANTFSSLLFVSAIIVIGAISGFWVFFEIFGVGLIDAGQYVKFGKSSGIFSLIFGGLIVFEIVFFTSLLFSTLLLLIGLSVPDFIYTLKGIFNILSLIVFELMLFFESLMLFSASKQYEDGGLNLINNENLPIRSSSLTPSSNLISTN